LPTFNGPETGNVLSWDSNYNMMKWISNENEYYVAGLGIDINENEISTTMIKPGTGYNAIILTGYAEDNSASSSGSYSIVMGFDTNASGGNSTAMGQNTTASGHGSTAIGVGAVASGMGSIAMGYDTNASGQYSTAIGRYINISHVAIESVGIGLGNEGYLYLQAPITTPSTFNVVGGQTVIGHEIDITTATSSNYSNTIRIVKRTNAPTCNSSKEGTIYYQQATAQISGKFKGCVCDMNNVCLWQDLN